MEVQQAEGKLRSLSESQCFAKSRSALISRIRSSLPLPQQLIETKDTPLSEAYNEYLAIIPVHQMYTTERSIASVAATQGAFSSIKITKETSTGHVYAVKVTSIGEEDLVKIAVKEYETLKDLSHPNIVHPSHFLIDTSLWKAYMFMPVLCEKTFSDLVAEATAPVSEVLVQHLACELFSALLYLHSRHIIHRDINPHNILYTNGHPTLIDFQTCSIDHQGKWLMSYVGTGGFAAPEMRSRAVYS